MKKVGGAVMAAIVFWLLLRRPISRLLGRLANTIVRSEHASPHG